MRRGALIRLIGVGLAAAAAAFAVAFFIPWLPEQASVERERIDFVFWFTTVVCIFVFGIVAGVTIYAAVRFRARPDDDSDGPPIHGHTRLEILWTAVPAVLVTGVSIVSAIALARNDSLPEDALAVEVTAEQFAWTFRYPDIEVNGEPLASSTLRLPLDRSAVLRITAKDVVHSFWVKEFGQKQDAVPGEINRLKITPTRLGRYDVVCTELCGLGHAFMRSQALVMRPARFDAWARSQQRARQGSPEQAGRAVFEDQGCGACHTFTPAGSTGRAGPNLDELPQQARRAGKELEAFTRESIIEPDAYVERGFSANVMPDTYDELPDQQLDALVQYLIRSGREGG